MKKKGTRKAFMFALAFICTNIVSAQDYMITFSGSGQSNEVETVEVKNTTQQTSVTLNGTDTLHLVDVVGISPLVQENAGMKVYPNPTKHTSRVDFYNPEAGNVIVEIIEITGKVLGSVQMNLTGGIQAFEIRGMGAGIFILKATTETMVYQQRLITHVKSYGNPQIIYLGSFGPSMSPAQTKSTKNIVEMQYNVGERLVVKGISGEYSHTKSLIPNESQNIDFEFIECVDGDENHYGVVTIGEQVWMAENLKTTHYRTGTPIVYPGADNNAWQNNTTGAYAWYNNDSSWKDSYGVLYNWYAGNNSNGLCPAGWHVPNDVEWAQLFDYAAAQGFPNICYDLISTGNALKSCRQVNSPLGGDCNTSEHPRWSSHNSDYGFDEFGFSAFPGGARYITGTFEDIGNFGNWWSSSESSATAWSLSISRFDGYVSYGYFNNKGNGFSVRCIRD